MPKRRNIIQNIGIDEAGRGPIAGPVAVGAVVIPQPVRLSFVGWGIRDWDNAFKDSKKLNKKQREKIFQEMVKLRRAGKLDFTVALSGAQVIDQAGITRAIALAIARALRRLAVDPKTSFVYLDGRLRAPEKFFQATIIQGDTKKLEIALASIVAKVTRDRHMIRCAKQYPGYGFEKHKGYGTRAHYAAITKRGMSTIHRKTFLNKLKERND